MVADRAMQVCHEAIRDFRTCHSSKLENAAVLSSAMQLQMLVTKCASNEDCQDMAAIFEEQLAAAAQRRFQSLCSLSSEDAGSPLSPYTLTDSRPTSASAKTLLLLLKLVSCLALRPPLHIMLINGEARLLCD